MDRYSERLVKGRVGSDAFIFIGIGILLAAGGIALTLFVHSIGLFILAAGVFVIVQGAQRFNVEFEYLILNGDIDIARIIAKKSRKTLKSINADEIEYMASMQNDRARNDLEVKKMLKIYDYTEKDPKAESYYVIFEKRNGKESAYILDLDEKSLDIMKEALKLKFRK